MNVYYKWDSFRTSQRTQHVCMTVQGETQLFQESRGTRQMYGQDKTQDFVSATPDGTHKYH
jgi:hypothetical protein